jgi:hypothetical protein
MIIDDPPTHDHSDSSIQHHSELSAHEYTDQSGSRGQLYLPPSSGVSSEVITSESDLPPLPPFKSSQPVKEAGLFKFFAPMPGGQAHATWSDKKRKYRDRDEEERTRILHQEEEQKKEKLEVRRGKNQLSQQKRRKKLQNQEIVAGVRDQDGKKIQVREIFILNSAG